MKNVSYSITIIYIALSLTGSIFGSIIPDASRGNIGYANQVKERAVQAATSAKQWALEQKKWLSEKYHWSSQKSEKSRYDWQFNIPGAIDWLLGEYYCKFPNAPFSAQSNYETEFAHTAPDRWDQRIVKKVFYDLFNGKPISNSHLQTVLHDPQNSKLLFQKATIKMNISVMEKILQKYPNFVDIPMSGICKSEVHTPLYIAVQQGNIPAIKLLIKKGANPNATVMETKWERSPLKHAQLKMEKSIKKLQQADLGVKEKEMEERKLNKLSEIIRILKK